MYITARTVHTRMTVSCVLGFSVYAQTTTYPHTETEGTHAHTEYTYVCTHMLVRTNALLSGARPHEKNHRLGHSARGALWSFLQAMPIRSSIVTHAFWGARYGLHTHTHTSHSHHPFVAQPLPTRGRITEGLWISLWMDWCTPNP